MTTTSIVNASPAPALTWHTFQDEGKRPQQEDRIAVHEFTTRDGMPATLFILADGIGGQGSGELASQRAVELIPAFIDAHEFTASEISSVLKAALEHANAQIYKEAEDNAQYAGMGTTCTAVVIIGKRLYIAHVGDSRAYLLRGNRLRQLSIDHTWAEEAIRAGRSPEEIRTHPNRSVIKRFLGIDPDMEIDTRYRFGDPPDNTIDSAEKPLFLEPGDTLMLCSDGVSDPLTTKEIISLLQKPVDKAPEALVQRALKAGSTDNVSAVVARLPGGSPVGATTQRRTLRLVGSLLLALLVLAAGVLALYARKSFFVQSTPSLQAAVAPPTFTPTPVQKQITPQPYVLETGAVSGGIEIATPAGQGVDLQTPTATPVLATPTPLAATATALPTMPPSKPTQIPPTRSTKSEDFSNTNITLIAPKEGIVGFKLTFQWQSAPPLSNNYQYELVIWPDGSALQQNGRSPVPTSDQLTLSTVDIRTIEDNGIHFVDGQTYYWGICIVKPNKSSPENRMKCTEGRSFVYQSPSQKSTSSIPGGGDE